MTSKIVVNNIESDAGVSTVFFNSDIGGTGGTLNVDGNLNVDGVLSYEDVTNIDSVGIITARSGIDVTSGNVNIDSTTSNTPLVVEASQNNRSRIVFRNNVETGTECNIELFDDDLRFVTNSGERLRIDVNGNIGIDNTTPHRQLVVGGGGDISCFGTNGGIYFGTSTGGFRNNGAIARAQQAGYHVSGSQVGDLVMAPEADKALIFSSGSTNTMYERLRLTTGGNIGINDSGPNFHLDVNGNIALREGQVLTWHDGSGNKAGDVYMDSSDNFVIRNTSSVTERLRITSAGKLLISGQAALTSTPQSHTLQVAAQSDANAIAIFGRASDDIGELSYYEADKSTKLGEIQYRQDHVNFRHRVGDIRFASGGTTERLRIASDGKIHVGGNGTATDQVNVIAAGGGINISRLNSGSPSVNEWLGALGFKGYATGNSSTGADARIHANAAFNHSGTSAPANLIFSTKGTSTGPGSAPTERLRITYDGALLHKGNNQYTIDNTDGDGQSSNGYPAGGATFNKNISVNNNAGGFGQCMNMISHTKVITLNGSTNHDMVTIWNREGCFIGHVYAGYSTGGDGAVAMYKFNTFYSANSIIAELGPSSRSSDTISVNISSSGDSHTFRVNGNGYSGDVTIGLVFLSAGVAGSAAHYGVRYY